jgi:FMN phosphatase YigB (HAD superfamily)
LLRALLFDLDDTLLETTTEVFIPAYIKALAEKLALRVSPDRLADQLVASTRLMVRPLHPQRTNQQVFDDDFYPRLGLSREDLAPLVQDFYARDHPRLRVLTRPRPQARQVVEQAFRLTDAVVIATQPVFPLVAIRQRLEWAAVADFPYRLITCSENMHTCKPDPSYYLEIAAFLGAQPQECLMVGNDPGHDIRPAAAAGLKTWWITGVGPADVLSDHRGSLADLGDWLACGL